MSKRTHGPYRARAQAPHQHQKQRRKPAAASLPQGSFRLRSWHITYHDAWHHLLFNEQPVKLTPREYRLMRAFLVPLAQAPLPIPSDMMLLTAISKQRLKQLLQVANSTLLRKYISNINRKLTPFGLRLVTVDDSYCLKVFAVSPVKEEGEDR